MTEKTALELYAEELMKYKEAKSQRQSGKKPHGPCGFFAKEWSADEIAMEKSKVDSLEDSFRGVIGLIPSSSHAHIANVIFQNHWRKKIPDEVWMYMVETVSRVQEKLALELCYQTELWGTYYENRLRICGPGDSAVYIYYTPRGRVPRVAKASRLGKDEIDRCGDSSTYSGLVYHIGGRRYWINDRCDREVAEARVRRAKGEPY